MIVQKYQLIDEIGSGSFSTVYKAQHIETKQFFAIKKMRQMPHNNFKVVQNQIELLKRIQHKNIVRYETDFKHKGKWYIVFEYCGKSDLENFKNKQQGRLPEAFCKNLAYSLVEALEILHENKIVHRDLKLANILINDNYDFKLADFGFSKDNELGIMESYCGTPYAMAPEILNRQSYDEKCDTWSLGVMIYQLVYGKLPFVPGKQFGYGIIGVTNCILKSEPQFSKDLEISQQCQNFIKLCLKKNKKQRPRMTELKKHPWINNGVESHIRREFLMNSLVDKNQAKNRAKQIFNGAIAEHIVKLITHMKLVGEQIKWNLKTVEQYYPENPKIKYSIIMMITKKIKQLQQKHIEIQLQGKKFIIGLKDIKSLRTHIDSLKQVLNHELKGMKNLSWVNLEKNIISFVANESQACLRLTENFPDKIKLIANLSQLPIKRFTCSQIQMNWSFNQNYNGPRNQFLSVLDTISYEQILKYINDSYCEENIHSNWLINHAFVDENREGPEIEIGAFIQRVISINYKEQNNH